MSSIMKKLNLITLRILTTLSLLIKMVFGLKKILIQSKEVISATKPDGLKLLNLTIFHLDKNSNLIEKFHPNI